MRAPSLRAPGSVPVNPATVAKPGSGMPGDDDFDPSDLWPLRPTFAAPAAKRAAIRASAPAPVLNTLASRSHATDAPAGPRHTTSAPLPAVVLGPHRVLATALHVFAPSPVTPERTSDRERPVVRFHSGGLASGDLAAFPGASSDTTSV